jgi:hypothetical protein
MARTVEWAKPPGRANARAMTGSARSLFDGGQDGGHGAKSAFAHPTTAKEPAK